MCEVCGEIICVVCGGHLISDKWEQDEITEQHRDKGDMDVKYCNCEET